MEPTNDSEEGTQKQCGADSSELHVHEDKVALLSDSDSAEEIPVNRVNEQEQTSDPNKIFQHETGINDEIQNDEQTKTDLEVSLRTDTQDGDADTSSSRPTCMTVRSRGQVLRILSRGSFFAIGLAILMAGGVASNYHPYYVNPNEYNNCTIPPKLNETM